MKRGLATRFGSQRNTGLSLVELMVALTLGLLIVGAVIQVFVTSRLTYNVNEGLGRVQENARFAMEFLQRDVRMAGSSAMCGGRPPEQVNWASDNSAIPEIVTLLDPDIAVRGWEYDGTATGTFVFDPPTLDDAPNQWSDGTPGLPEFLQGRALPGSDVLGLRVFEVANPDITGCVGAGNTADSVTIETCSRSGGDPEHGVQTGELWAVADCRVAVEICRQTAAGTATILNCSNGEGNVRPSGTAGNWRTDYEGDMELYLPRTIFYYVGENPAGRRALFRASNCAGSGGGTGCRIEELVEGVDSLQLFYRLNDNPAGLFAANAGINWANVHAVVVHLIVSSPNEVDGRQLSQDLVLDNNLIFRTNDRRVRHAYPATIAIRNRLEVF